MTSDEQTFRTVIEWIANLSDAELHDYDWRAHRANCRNLLDVSEGGRLDAGRPKMTISAWRTWPVTKDGEECVCAEINMRHCPVHGQDAWDALAKAADPSVTKDGE